MKVLQKTLLSQVAGGEADEVVFAVAGGGDWGGGDWGSGGDYGWDSGGDYGWDGGGGFAVSSPAFDNNGVGMTSCVPMPPPPAPLTDGLFGYTLTETVGILGAATTLTAGISGAVGASLTIDAAGGLSGLGALGGAATGITTAAGLGLLSSFGAGVLVGTMAYQNSETVRDVSQAAVGYAFEVVENFKQIGADVLGIERAPEPVYHP